MKKILTLLSATCALFALQLHAEEVELTGIGTCAKCDLKTAPACQNVLQVDGKIYELTGSISKSFHRHLCKESAKITVKGEKSESGDAIEVKEIAKVD